MPELRRPTAWLDHPGKPATVESTQECLRVLTRDRRRNHSLPFVSLLLSIPPPTVKVLKIFCQTHSFDNNPAESRSSPKVHAAPGVAADPPPPFPLRLCQQTGRTKRTFFPFLNLQPSCVTFPPSPSYLCRSCVSSAEACAG